MIGFGTGILPVGFQSDFAVFIRCCFCGSKMVCKNFHELTANKLRVELRRAGIKEKYTRLRPP